MFYAYLIGWSTHQKFYYGVRISEKAKPSDLWKNYFTSSKYVKAFSKEYGEPDIISIRKTFTDAKTCVKWEKRFLNKVNAKDNPKFLNRTNGFGSFQTNIGTIPAKDLMTGKPLGRIRTDDERITNGVAVHVSKDMPRSPLSIEHREKHLRVIRSPENRLKVSIAVRSAMSSPSIKAKMKLAHRKETCIHCGVMMKRPAINNYHQDNCLLINPSRKAVASGRKWFNDGTNSFMKLPHEVTEDLVIGRLKER